MKRRTLEHRHLTAAVLAGLRWLVNPVSENGAKQVPRFKLLAGGPELLRDIATMRNHPDGARILATKPDLGAALSDVSALAAMPANSLGRAFHAAMSIPNGIPGYLLASLIYKDGFFDSFDLDPDTRYVIARSRWFHDLFHIVTGYGTDLPGEGLLIFFMLAYEHGLSWRAASLVPLGIGPRIFIRPSCGQTRWRALLHDAHRRGLAARSVIPPNCVPWESLLPRPLDEVRQLLGIAPFTENTRSWLDHNWFGRQAAIGFGAYPREAASARIARRIVEAGVSAPDLYRLSAAHTQRLADLVAAGASDDVLRATAETLGQRSQFNQT